MGKPLTLPHGGQILTTKRGIRDFCRGNVEMIACNALVFCIAAGPDHPDYVDVLYAASSRLYMLDLLVYQSKDGIVKPGPKWYWKQLFQGFLETPEEAAERAERLGFSEENKALLFRQVEHITALWCGMLSKYGEIAFTYEFAYGADYVIRRKGKLPLRNFPRARGCSSPPITRTSITGRESGLISTPIFILTIFRRQKRHGT